MEWSEGGGWRVAEAAIAAGTSERQRYRWLARYRSGGAAALNAHSSAAHRCEHRVGEIVRLPRQRISGLVISRQPRIPTSAVGAISRRLGLGKPAALEPKPVVVRCERQRPGELIHIDSRKLGRIEGIEHCITSRTRGALTRHHDIGPEALHVCVDDATWLAYSEILAN